MTADLEMEAKRTGFVTCVEVLLADGSRCFYAKAELATRPPEVVAVYVGRADVLEPERRQPAKFEPVKQATGTYFKQARQDTYRDIWRRSMCINSCDSTEAAFCNGRRARASLRCVCACHVVAR